MKKPSQKKELPHPRLKREGERRRSVRAVHRRAASTEEAAAVERALDGLLVELVRQELAARRKTS
jgi:hypothetical protein